MKNIIKLYEFHKNAGVLGEGVEINGKRMP
jgi:hypothetical protein